MKKLLALLGLFGLLGFTDKIQAETFLAPAEFTKAFVSYLQSTNQDLNLEILGALEVKVTKANKDLGTLFLNNVYALYQQQPERKDELFSKYAASILENKEDTLTSLGNLVAVVKDRKWAEEMDKTTMGAEGKGFHILTQNLNDDLIIAYANDTPQSVSYPDREKIWALEKSIDTLRVTGVNNLRRVIGPYDFELLEHDVYQAKSITGDYDASIPLLDNAFASFIQKTGATSFVFSIPARNILIVTDPQNGDGMPYLKSLTESIYKSDPYYISPNLYRIDDGKWEIYKE